MTETALVIINLVVNLLGVVPLVILLWWRSRAQGKGERIASVAYESGVAEGRTTVTLALLSRLQGADNVEKAIQEWMREELTVLDLEQKPSYMDLMVGERNERKSKGLRRSWFAPSN